MEIVYVPVPTTALNVVNGLGIPGSKPPLACANAENKLVEYVPRLDTYRLVDGILIKEPEFKPVVRLNFSVVYDVFSAIGYDVGPTATPID
jgi:hypothetical protein